MLYYEDIKSTLEEEFKEKFNNTPISYSEAFDIAYLPSINYSGPNRVTLEDTIKYYLTVLLKDYEKTSNKTKTGGLLRKIGSPILRVLINLFKFKK